PTLRSSPDSARPRHPPSFPTRRSSDLLRVAADHLVLMAVVGASAGEGEALYQVPLVLRRPQQSPDRTQESPHRPRESPHRTQESPHRPRGRAVQSQGGAGQSVASPDPPEEGAEIGVIAVPGG